MRQAVMYTRVSSKDQEREGFSIPAQQALLREYAAKQGASDRPRVRRCRDCQGCGP